MTWHPRGEPIWPDWKTAEPGTRVEHVQSGRQGTLKRAVVVGRTPGNKYAVIMWDPVPGIMGGEPIEGRVVAPAFDLRPLPE